MTRREIVIRALEHKETQPIPFHMDFTEQALENLIAYTGDPDIESKLGTYLYYKQYWGWPTEIPGKPVFTSFAGTGNVFEDDSMCNAGDGGTLIKTYF